MVTAYKTWICACVCVKSKQTVAYTTVHKSEIYTANDTFYTKYTDVCLMFKQNINENKKKLTKNRIFHTFHFNGFTVSSLSPTVLGKIQKK